MPGGQPPRVKALRSDQLPSGSKPSTTSSPSPGQHARGFAQHLVRVRSRTRACAATASRPRCRTAARARRARRRARRLRRAARDQRRAARARRATGTCRGSPQAPDLQAMQPERALERRCRRSRAPARAAWLPSGPASQASRSCSGARPWRKHNRRPAAAASWPPRDAAHSRMLDVRPIPAFQDNYIWMIRGARDPRGSPSSIRAMPAPVLAAPRARRTDARRRSSRRITTPITSAASRRSSRRPAPRCSARARAHAGRRAPLRGGRARAARRRSGSSSRCSTCPATRPATSPCSAMAPLFCGDTLFSAGCGRLFEGTPERDARPRWTPFAGFPTTPAFSAATSTPWPTCGSRSAVEPGNSAIMDYVKRAPALRAEGRPTLPSTIGLEKRVNPFLRSRHENVKSSAERRAGRMLPTPVAVFAEIRSWKDTFR